MVLGARIEFLKQQLSCGKMMVINLLPNSVNSRLKVKALVKPVLAPIPGQIRDILFGSLDQIARLAKSMTAVDRGNLHSDGTMEVSIWLSVPGEKSPEKVSHLNP